MQFSMMSSENISFIYYLNTPLQMREYLPWHAGTDRNKKKNPTIDSVNEHQNIVTATIQLETIVIIVHSRQRERKHFIPSISSIVRHANELWLSPNFPRLCWLSAILKTCQLSNFWSLQK